jgi:hypothetical protein
LAAGGTVSAVSYIFNMVNMAEGDMMEKSAEPNEGNEYPDYKEEEHGDMDDYGKIFINHSALRNKFRVC